MDLTLSRPLTVDMQISAECRWFMENASAGSDLHRWFLDSKIHGCKAGGGHERRDDYLLDSAQVELGIKRRGKNPGVEIKGLVRQIETPLEARRLTGDIEIWMKWTTTALDLSCCAKVAIVKTRWLRKFDTRDMEAIELQVDEDERLIGNVPLPQRGCNVEFTIVRVDGKIWTSLALEAFGTLDSVESSLRLTAECISARNPPMDPDAIQASYPAWLSLTLRRGRDR
jgi:hypothetical protein